MNLTYFTLPNLPYFYWGCIGPSEFRKLNIFDSSFKRNLKIYMDPYVREGPTMQALGISNPESLHSETFSYTHLSGGIKLSTLWNLICLPF
jgi:hypothetical protein